MLLRALGYSTNTDIFNAFGTTKNLNPQKDKLSNSGTADAKGKNAPNQDCQSQ